MHDQDVAVRFPLNRAADALAEQPLNEPDLAAGARTGATLTTTTFASRAAASSAVRSSAFFAGTVSS